MIAVRLMGGLGNQMFQYALARKLAIKNKTDVVMDLVFYENIAKTDTPRKYELDCFKLRAKFLDPQERPHENPESVYKGFRGSLRKVKHSLKGVRWSIYRESGHEYDSNVLSTKNSTYLIGFWQTERYFKDIRPILIGDFEFKSALNPKSKKILDSILGGPSISLHVRRGDYVSNPSANKFHGTKDNDYYQSALRLIVENQPADYTVFVFSDDINWCKKNIKPNLKTVYVSGNKDGFEDMRLMSACNHNIIANSSFSWWAAWLNQNEGKIVVGPKVWFQNKSIDTSDVLPSTWKSI
jgi:hypothetical protein